MKVRSLFFALAMGLFAAPAVLTASADITIIVVDQGKVLEQSKAGKDMAQKLNTMADQIEGDLKRKDGALQVEQKGLKDKIAPLNQAAIAQDQQLQNQLKNFESKVQNFEISRRKEAAQLELTRRDAMVKYSTALQAAIKSVMAERKADLVLERSLVIESATAIDVTDAVIAKLDATSPTIAVVKQALPEKKASQ